MKVSSPLAGSAVGLLPTMGTALPSPSHHITDGGTKRLSTSVPLLQVRNVTSSQLSSERLRDVTVMVGTRGGRAVVHWKCTLFYPSIIKFDLPSTDRRCTLLLEIPITYCAALSEAGSTEYVKV